MISILKLSGFFYSKKEEKKFRNRLKLYGFQKTPTPNYKVFIAP